ncbi:glycosyltransferase family 2 protein [Nocardioides currus]|uniref:glycosyltransferase family 2 protein n=1 Tax=Nocardioides currus TaxID=2133958 RepID=UPI0014028147|nr:glycosyltransferase family 2 protein [Nocardioides currus]
MSTPTVLIPALRPGPALLRTIADLRTARPAWALVVVDDGSGAAYAPVFDDARTLGADVLTLPRNGGKGAALKAGFAHVARTRPGSAVVCADADAQHALRDILAVGTRVDAAPGVRRIVLGTRTFDGHVPLRSRVGNDVTRWLFTAATRRRLTDTQTGLRGIPADLLGWACTVPGERYEYELQVLLRAGRAGIELDPVPIATIYLDDNTTSHFRPVADSVRIYLPLLAFLASALAAFAIDTVALLTLEALTGDLLLAVLGARLTSAGVNFAVNRRLVFDARHVRGAAWRYALLAASLLALNFLLLTGLTGLGVPLLAAKVLTELALVPTSFAAQRHLVFVTGSSDVHRDVRRGGRRDGRTVGRPASRPTTWLTGASQGDPTSPTGHPTTIDTTSR